MNSEEQHELTQNDLGKLLERTRARYAILVEEQGNRILLWIGALLVLLAAWIFYSRTSSQANADGWAAISAASNPEEFLEVADTYAKTPVGSWARLNAAERYLQSGINQQFIDRSSSATDLDGAKEAFENVLNDSLAVPAVRERALFGMARTQEATSKGDLKPAIAAYEKLLQEFPDSPYKPLAERQVKLLKTKKAEGFYAWFAEQKPTPQDRTLPSDLLRSMMPNLPADLSNEAGTATPEMPGEAAPQEGAAAPGNPTLTVPAAPDFPPKAEGQPEMKDDAAKPAASEKQESEKTESEKPATPPADPAAKPEEKAADNKPADSKPAEEKAAPAPEASEKPAESAEKPAAETPSEQP